ncbi:hypothetical protein M758_4G169900 [Ceratodon purpureus]|nr:hypothetical protein M758_4G169900 [Ceratodon purpureus]
MHISGSVAPACSLRHLCRLVQCLYFCCLYQPYDFSLWFVNLFWIESACNGAQCGPCQFEGECGLQRSDCGVVHTWT